MQQELAHGFEHGLGYQQRTATKLTLDLGRNNAQTTTDWPASIRMNPPSNCYCTAIEMACLCASLVISPHTIDHNTLFISLCYKTKLLKESYKCSM